MNLAIVGYRDFHDFEFVEKHIDDYIASKGKPDKIVSGGADGIDSLAEMYAKNHNIPIIVHPADWTKYGKQAGPLRNQLIINDATHMIAFPSSNSKGTFHTIGLAKKKGIDCVVIYV